jgi:hypothetical protein
MSDAETIIRKLHRFATKYDPSVVELLLEEIDRLRAREPPSPTPGGDGLPTSVVVETLEAEVARLKAGHFTGEEFQNLCHTFSPEDECAFRRGCVAYQGKLFGRESVWYGLLSPVFVSFWSV